MNDQGKNNVKKGVEVLLLFILGSLAIAASFGCFNYATLAKKAGDPENIFWLVGIANLVYNGFIIYHIAKMLPKDE